ncbi:MAG: hypothetical protein EON52_08215 [Actinomycetales bacterium]|nr:MAG: hypothetical protein EON52_08215 [Actinomycetales bacterium]
MIKNAWTKLPPWLRGAVGLVLTLLVVGTGRTLIDEVGRKDPAWGLALSISLLVLLFVGLYVMYRVGRNRVGGRAQHKLFRQALRSGELPADADIERWRPWLEKAAGDSSGEWVYAFLALLVFGVNVSAVGGVDDPGPGIILGAVGIAVVVAAVFPGLPWWIQHRNRRNAQHLLAKI